MNKPSVVTKALCPQTYANQHYTFTHSGEVNMKSQFNLIIYFIAHFWSFFVFLFPLFIPSLSSNIKGLNHL